MREGNGGEKEGTRLAEDTWEERMWGESRCCVMCVEVRRGSSVLHIYLAPGSYVVRVVGDASCF